MSALLDGVPHRVLGVYPEMLLGSAKDRESFGQLTGWVHKVAGVARDGMAITILCCAYKY